MKRRRKDSGTHLGHPVAFKVLQLLQEPDVGVGDVPGTAHDLESVAPAEGRDAHDVDDRHRHRPRHSRQTEGGRETETEERGLNNIGERVRGRKLRAEG